jgi:SAM-dependent methyltransferase
LATRGGIVARRNIYSLFVREMRSGPSTTILDIGTSDVEGDEANMLQKMHRPVESITCAGLGTGEQIRARYPGIRYVQIEAGSRLPFADQEFDVVHSNAVLEHVGGVDQRREFIREALRVGRQLFFVVPNRWFPVEHHTGVPLVHFLPSLFRRLTRGGRHDHWARAEHLEFLSKRKLREEWPKDHPPASSPIRAYGSDLSAPASP